MVSKLNPALDKSTLSFIEVLLFDYAVTARLLASDLGRSIKTQQSMRVKGTGRESPVNR
jgi:hypothetical protein